eukprot:GEZU01023153.1.p1 GENE.GEZU01023153.1~~GEZU01023153.1.p1  ORF type:complete len:196 (+),score=44.68 GEZU01023153.1:50-589(+)
METKPSVPLHGATSNAPEATMIDQQQLVPMSSDDIYKIEEETHRKRAERFGVEYKDLRQSILQQQPATTTTATVARSTQKEKQRSSGFVTGFDMFSEEEMQKRAARAKKFGSTNAAATTGDATEENNKPSEVHMEIRDAQNEITDEDRGKNMQQQFPPPTTTYLQHSIIMHHQHKYVFF